MAALNEKKAKYIKVYIPLFDLYIRLEHGWSYLFSLVVK